jgi:hypothetical protein
MSNQFNYLINTSLQRGADVRALIEPFQRLGCAGKTVETVFLASATGTGLKPGANEKTSHVDAKGSQRDGSFVFK